MRLPALAVKLIGLGLVLTVLAVGAVACDGDGGDDGGAADAIGGDDTSAPNDASVEDTGSTTDDVVVTVDVGEEDTPSTDTGAPVCPCPDDGVLCTTDECDEAGECQHVPFDIGNQAAVGTVAPDFTLTDVNPESATSGQTFTLSELIASGVATVLLFHSADCVTCLEQGKAARAFWTTYEDDDGVLFAAVNTPTAADDVMDYVNADPDTVEGFGPPSTWAVLQDTVDEDVWGRYCVDTDWVVVVGVNGQVLYMRAVNFEDPPFLPELESAIEHAKAPAQDAQ